jgi:deltex-like protein
MATPATTASSTQYTQSILTADQLELQWFDDAAWKWIPYIQLNQIEVRKHFTDNQSPLNLKTLPSMNLVVPGIGNYTLDFTRMRQINQATWFDRKIRFINTTTRQEIAPPVSNNDQVDNEDNYDDEVDEEEDEDDEIVEAMNIEDEKKDMFAPIQFSTLSASDQCVLCFESFTATDEIVIPVNCTGHFFHRKCPGMDMGIEDYMKKTKQCPACKKRYGIITGNMPRGKMTVNRLDMQLPGFEKYKTLEIVFDFPGGRQGDDHPNPGARYGGDHRVAYLPDSDEGRHVLSLLKKAWDRKLLFTIGTSVTRGIDGCIIYNGIHFKSVPYATPSEPWGWPDPTYLHRVVQELNEKGVY